MLLTSKDAAYRLIRFSIKCYVRKYEPLSTHLCAQSAMRICRDKLKLMWPERDILGGLPAKDVATFLNEFSSLNNFLKHSDRGPEHLIVENIDNKNASVIFLACRYYKETFGINADEKIILWFQIYRIKLDPLHRKEQISDLDPDFMEMSPEELLSMIEDEFELDDL